MKIPHLLSSLHPLHRRHAQLSLRLIEKRAVFSAENLLSFCDKSFCTLCVLCEDSLLSRMKKTKNYPRCEQEDNIQIIRRCVLLFPSQIMSVSNLTAVALALL